MSAIQHVVCEGLSAVTANHVHMLCSAFADEESPSLSCNTEKDRHIRLNIRTAGIQTECIVILYGVCLLARLSECIIFNFTRYPCWDAPVWSDHTLV